LSTPPIANKQKPPQKFRHNSPVRGRGRGYGRRNVHDKTIAPFEIMRIYLDVYFVRV